MCEQALRSIVFNRGSLDVEFDVGAFTLESLGDDTSTEETRRFRRIGGEEAGVGGTATRC